MSDDPLEAADVGETVTVEQKNKMWLGDLADYDGTAGSDRFATHDVTDVSVETNEYGSKHLVVTVESDVTKRLAPRWDSEPRPAASTDGGGRSWRQVAMMAAINLGVVGIAVLITSRIADDMSGETITLEPVSLTFWDLAGPAVVLALLLTVIVYGVQGGFPRRVGGGRR